MGMGDDSWCEKLCILSILNFDDGASNHSEEPGQLICEPNMIAA